MAALSKTLTRRRLQETWFFRFYKSYLVDGVLIVRTYGFRELMRRRGWKFLLVVVSYYLVRDIILYLMVPFLIAKGLMV